MKNPHWIKGAAAACLLLPAVNASAVTFDFDLLGSFRNEVTGPGGTFIGTGTERYEEVDITGGDDDDHTVTGSTTGDPANLVNPAADILLSWTVTDSQFDLKVEGANGVARIFQNDLDSTDVSLTINNLFLDLGFEVEMTSATLKVIGQDGDELFAPFGGNGLTDGLGPFAFAFDPSLLAIGDASNPEVIDVSIAYTRTSTGGGGGTVPEPATLALLGLGLLGIGAARRRRS